MPFTLLLKLWCRSPFKVRLMLIEMLSAKMGKRRNRKTLAIPERVPVIPFPARAIFSRPLLVHIRTLHNDRKGASACAEKEIKGGNRSVRAVKKKTAHNRGRLSFLS